LPGGEGRFIVRVTPGVAGALRLISGNNQSAQAGTALAAPMVVELDSTSGAGLVRVHDQLASLLGFRDPHDREHSD
jgi:hypothetical protein